MKKTYSVINNKYVVDKETSIKKGDSFISLYDDESYLDVQISTVDDFKDWAESDYTDECHKIIATIGEENRINGLPVIEFKSKNYSTETYKQFLLDSGKDIGYAQEGMVGYCNGMKDAQSKGCWTDEDILSFINNEDNHTEGEFGNSCIDVNTLRNHFSSKKQPQLTEIELDVQSQYYEDIPHNTDNPDFIWNLIITHSNDKGGIIKIYKL